MEKTPRWLARAIETAKTEPVELPWVRAKKSKAAKMAKAS